MIAAVLIYLTLCLPAYLRIDACAGESGAALHACAGVGVVCLRYDVRIVLDGGRLCVKQQPFRRGRRKRSASQTRKSLKKVLRSILRVSHTQNICAYARIGLEDAAQTALAAGAVRAVFCAAMAGVRHAAQCVIPDYGSAGVLITLRCIFAASPGDTLAELARRAIAKWSVSEQEQRGRV